MSIRGPFVLRNGHIYGADNCYIASVVSPEIGQEVVEALNRWWEPDADDDDEAEMLEDLDPD